MCAYSKDLDQLSVKLKDTVFLKKVFWNICLQEIFVFETVLRSRGTEGRLSLEDIGRGRRRIVGKI